MTPEILLQIVTALGGIAGLGAVFDRIRDRRALKLRAQAEADKASTDVERAEIDAAAAVTNVALGLLDPLRTQIASLHRDLEESRREVRALGAYIEVLIGALRIAQIPVPPFGPPP